MTCPRCAADPRPPHFANGRECAFGPDGVFRTPNWNCATLATLRERALGTCLASEEQSVGVQALGGTFLLLGWYKRRGMTEWARVVDGLTEHPLTLAAAEAFVDLDDDGLHRALYPEREP